MRSEICYTSPSLSRSPWHESRSPHCIGFLSDAQNFDALALPSCLPSLNSLFFSSFSSSSALRLSSPRFVFNKRSGRGPFNNSLPLPLLRSNQNYPTKARLWAADDARISPIRCRSLVIMWQMLCIAHPARLASGIASRIRISNLDFEPSCRGRRDGLHFHKCLLPFCRETPISMSCMCCAVRRQFRLLLARVP